jgi:Uncharacterised nucleotidyltransferase
MKDNSRQAQDMKTLSWLVVPEQNPGTQQKKEDLEHAQLALRYAASLAPEQLNNFVELANTHHVIVRALSTLKTNAVRENEQKIAERCQAALTEEKVRIERAVGFLHSICNVLQRRGCEVAVIKSLDHWPDLGSDLDLYTTADHQQVEQVMRDEFNATPAKRSWGDRLANKWNFSVPGLPELVEIHIQYLGQTGEHADLARRVVARGITKEVGGYEFRVPAPEERIVISSLQRVYRHFYFRLCDMIDTASLLQSGAVNFAELKRAANSASIWPGVATYLCLVQNYIQSYGGTASLPEDVKKAAQTPESTVQFRNGYLRVSMATAVSLYSLQLLQAGLHRDVRALVRLPLLPPLAISALVAHSLTGNDKGIW